MHYLGFTENLPSPVVGALDEVLMSPYRELDAAWRGCIGGAAFMTMQDSALQENDKKDWYTLECSRMAMILKNYQWFTLLVLLPALLVMDLALLNVAVSQGWWREKIQSMLWCWRLSTWRYLLKQRQQIAKIRAVPDRLLLQGFTSTLPNSLRSEDVVLRLIQPFLDMYFQLVKMMIGWQR